MAANNLVRNFLSRPQIGVTHLLTLRQFPSEARSVAEENKILSIDLAADAEINLTAGLIAGASLPTEIELAGPQDIALILLTSDSTGRSKKVPLTHRKICVSLADIRRTEWRAGSPEWRRLLSGRL